MKRHYLSIINNPLRQGDVTGNSQAIPIIEADIVTDIEFDDVVEE